MRLFLIFLPLMLIACDASYTQPVYFKNTLTGEVVSCGPYEQSTNNSNPKAQEEKCVKEATDRGYLRIPSPH